MKKTCAFALALSLAAAGSALAADAPKVLAVIGSEKITQADLDQAASRLDPQQQMMLMSPEGQKRLLENLVDLKLFARSGREQGLTKSEKYRQTMADIEERVLFTLATEKVLDEVSKKTFTDADAQKFYNEHTESFRVPPAVRASHILFQTGRGASKDEEKAARTRAAEVLHDIKTGKISFADAAKKFGTDGTKDRGGDLGFFSKGQMVPAFEKAAFAIKKGELCKEPVKSDFGYHLIQVTDTRDSSIQPFSAVKEDIKADMKQQAQIKAIQDARDALRAKYKVSFTAEEKAPAKQDAKK